MSETKTWTGGCHCGRIRFEAEMALEGLKICNCSFCQKRGSIMGFVPENAFRMLSGENEQAEYEFNKKVIHHTFCPTCGIGSHSYGTTPSGATMVAVNVRCLDGVEADKLTPTLFDGKSL
ncbi:GFA family protein [Hyphomicrobium sp.]|uniref:GFA family protein n=1 Tax=Hyphomicrobium sp. TaxID=82 RepID=UPI000FC2F1D3|nr:GFA family protein [Hyphomicrobium sp.]RUO98795.1 MAG: GFA family protein [Hyphomicrobium sp.]